MLCFVLIIVVRLLVILFAKITHELSHGQLVGLKGGMSLPVCTNLTLVSTTLRIPS